MNHVTFNKEILLPNDFLMASDDLKSFKRLMPESTMESPIFLWDDMEDDKLLSLPGNEDVIRQIQNEPNLLPFKTMRLYVRANLSDSRDGTKGFKVWMHHEKGILHTRVSMQGPKDQDAITGIFTNPNSGTINVFSRFGKRIANERDFPPHLWRMLQDQSQAIFTSICWFIREVTSPSNFIASVIPDKSGKSVEWTRARTHYVVIHKAHPANNKEVKAGVNVVTSAETLKRQAHSRRAHARILRSPRFKNKVGQTIRVKSCWVGPNEWKQFGSVYRMTNINSHKQ